MAVEVLSGKVFLLITGASQGIGCQIAVTFSEHLEKGSKVLLLARNENGLKETADKIPKRIAVAYHSVDLAVAQADVLSEIITKHANPADYDRAVIVHNAASLGDLTKYTTDMTDYDYWRKYYDLNVFSPAVLNSVFIKIFNENVKAKKVVINITSIAGILPFKVMGYYCSGKAARAMYFKVFAEEYPQVNVINYSPGPVETNLLRFMVDNIIDTKFAKRLEGMREKKRQLTTEQTASRLIEILREQKYKSGDHVEYYDNISDYPFDMD